MANYKISDTTLTAIGDAIRGKVGDTREEMAPFENPYEFNFDYADYVFNDIPLLPSGYRGLYLPVVTNKDAKRAEILYECEGKGGINYLDLRTIRYSYGDNRDKFDDTTAISLNYSGTKNISFNGEEQYLVLDIGFREHHDTQLIIKFNIYLYDANDNLITQELVEVPNTMTPEQMAQVINDIPPAPTEQDLVITGDCSYRFANGGWDWVLNKYGDKITTKDIANATNMFFKIQLNEIPFEINFKDGGGSCNLMFSQSKLTSIPSIDFKHNNYSQAGRLFDNCIGLKEIGTLKNLYPDAMDSMFTYNRNLRYLPKFENLNLSRVQTYSYANCGSIFYNCYSLREIPEEFLKQLYGTQTSYSYLSFYDLRYCYSLDEVKGLSPRTGALTSNAFNYALRHLSRVKDIVFDIQDDGTPYSANWKSQTIDLTQNIGYLTDSSMYRDYVLNYNSGITADKEVVDDATYQALKDNPDWFTCKVEYSRYNHDSAVNTINSLPIITATGATNTIQFKGEAGSLTDGGAINTLTAEEIAVATAKGWTVTYA